MPLHDTDILPTQHTRIEVGLEPVHNALYSLLLLYKSSSMPGVTDWVRQTSVTMSDDLRHQHGVVVNGLHYAIQPDRSYSNFTVYIDSLAAQQPEALRDRVLKGACEHNSTGPRELPDLSNVLSSAEAYITFLHETFPGTELDIPVETEAFYYMREPERMQNMIVSHLRTMWHMFLEREWHNIQPMLLESVNAFQQLDLNTGSTLEVARKITGHDLVGSKWEQLVGRANRVIFVPSAHIGPYLGKFFQDNVLWLLFGARLPEGTRVAASAVSRSELLVRLGALDDDTRLRILALLSQYGELCAPDIMVRLNLSQSATSRHLQQLSATGYVSERRREGAKCYSLNHDRIQATFSALERFLSTQERI
jgi:DNA-binding transcriptional ArsR family regulator